MRYYDDPINESMARGGTFDIQGTSAVATKKIWGFTAGESTVISAIKGILVTENKEIQTEVDVKSLLTNDASKSLFTNTIYRIPGYIITSVTLSSGSLHCFLTSQQ